MTLYIVIVTVAVSILALNNAEVMGKLIFNPYLVQHRNQWYRFFTSGFIHADWMHLIVNVMVLYSFGRVVEADYAAVFANKSTYYYLLLYFGALFIAAAPGYAKNKSNPGYNALGASGAVSAVIFAGILFHPMEKLYLLGVPALGIPGILFGPAYLFYEWYMGKRGGDNIGHDAHFWGAIFGLLFTITMKPAVVLYFLDQLKF